MDTLYPDIDDTFLVMCCTEMIAASTFSKSFISWVSQTRFLAAYMDPNFKCKIDPSDALTQDMNEAFSATSSVSTFKPGQRASNSFDALNLCGKIEVDIDGWASIVGESLLVGGAWVAGNYSKPWSLTFATILSSAHSLVKSESPLLAFISFYFVPLGLY